MSIWNDNYEARYKELNIPSITILERDITREMEEFVGTRKQYEDEKKLRFETAKQKKAETDRMRRVKMSLLFIEWKEELRLSYGMSKDLFDIIFEVADERTCSGHDEVEGYFDSYTEDFLKVYMMGRTDGREGV